MAKSLFFLRGFGVMCAGMGMILAPWVSVAEVASKIEETTDLNVCVTPAVEKAVTSCPDGVNFRSDQGVSRAKVATASKDTKSETKKVEAKPGLQREFAKDIAESAFTRKREKKKLDILRSELELLEKLAQNTRDTDPEKGDVLKRVADYYKSFYDEYNYLARDLDEKIYLAKTKGKKKKQKTLTLQQNKLDSMARQYREKAIKTYVQIKQNHPDYAGYDEILFAIGYEIDQLAIEIRDENKKAAYRERARMFYRELIRNHERSKYIPHAWMAFGEYYFHEAKDAKRAMKSYERVTAWGAQDNPNFVIAMYYQAWCMFNLQEYQQTIEQFIRVVQFAAENPENREAQAVSKRARMEIVDAFAKIGSPSGAWKLFSGIGGDLAQPMLAKLAEVYYDDGQWKDAIIVLHKLEELEIENYRKNNSDDLCIFQHKIANASINSSPKEQQLVELKRLLKLYKKFSTEGNHDPQKVDKCAADTIALAWDLATSWHLEAVGSESSPGTKNEETMKVAVKLYETILASFPNLDELEMEGYSGETRPSRYKVAYYIADLHWTMENWSACGPAFDKVVEINPKGELTADAAYGAVLCYNKVYADEMGKTDRERRQNLRANYKDNSEDSSKKAQKKCLAQCKGANKQACAKKCTEPEKSFLSPRDFTDIEAGILSSYERYVCYVKDGEDLVKIKYRKARIYYEANRFEEAAVLFKDIVMNHSNDELAIFAANLYLDSLNALGDMMEIARPGCYDDLANIVNILLDESKSPGKDLMQNEEFASQVKQLKVGVLRKKAEALTKRKQFRESAKIYLTIYREYAAQHTEQGMCEVLFNAAINMEAARLVMPAIKVREKMINAYPDCEHTKKAAFYIGQNFHALQMFRQAADNYLSFAKRFPGEEEAPDALANSIMFYIGLGDYEDAWSSVRLFKSMYQGKYPTKTATVFFSAGYIYVNEAEESKKVERWEPVREHYRKYLKEFIKVKAIDEQVQAHVLIGDSYWNQRPRETERALQSYEEAVALFNKKAMEKVSENQRKAEMLTAAAKARYIIAENKFLEFARVKFPDFNPEKDLPDHIAKWWNKKVGKKAVDEKEQVRKYRRLLVAWGEMDRKEARRETQLEDANVQFEFWLEKRFKPWMDKKTALLGEANKLFAEVVEMHVPEWEMAASARAGDMQLQFMNALYDAPLPPAFKNDEELTTVYRQSMDEKAEPFREVAIKLYDHCLNVSTKIRWFNENSRRCEEQLHKLSPVNYPVSEEIRIGNNNELVFYVNPKLILELKEPDKETQSEEPAYQEEAIATTKVEVPSKAATGKAGPSTVAAK